MTAGHLASEPEPWVEGPPTVRRNAEHVIRDLERRAQAGDGKEATNRGPGSPDSTHAFEHPPFGNVP